MDVEGVAHAKKVVVTSLTNYAMPFLRYEIGDLATPSVDLCPCGRYTRTLASIDGRDSDVLRTKDDKNITIHEIADIMNEIPGIMQFQILQNSRSQITFILATYEEYNRAYEPTIVDEIRRITNLTNRKTSAPQPHSEQRHRFHFCRAHRI